MNYKSITNFLAFGAVLTVLAGGSMRATPVQAAAALNCNPANVAAPVLEDGPEVLASRPVTDATGRQENTAAAFSLNQAVVRDEPRGITYVAYYDATFTLTVAAQTADGAWSTEKPRKLLLDASDNRVGWSEVTLARDRSDSHQELSIAVDSSGALHLAGAIHNEDILYWRETVPGDLGSLTFRSELPGASKNGWMSSLSNERVASYPTFFQGGDGALHMIFRDGITNAANNFIYSYDAASTRWSSVTGLAPLWNGDGKDFKTAPGVYGAYPTTPVWRDDKSGGMFHVAWVWRGHDSKNTNLSYAWSRNLKDWYPMNRNPVDPGIALSLPFTPMRSETLVDAGTHGGLVNGQVQVGFDYSGRVMLTYPRNNPHGDTKLYAARPTGQVNSAGTTWRISDLTAVANDMNNVAGEPLATYISTWNGAQTLEQPRMWHPSPVSLEGGRLIVRYACTNPVTWQTEFRMFKASDTGISGVTFGMEDTFDSKREIPEEISERDSSTGRYPLATRYASTAPFVVEAGTGWAPELTGRTARIIMRWEAGGYVSNNVWPSAENFPASGSALRIYLVDAG